MNRWSKSPDRSRDARRRAVRPAIEGLEGRMLLSKAGSPAAVARARNQNSNSPNVPKLDTPIPVIYDGISSDNDPANTGYVLSPKVKITGAITAYMGTVWLGRGPRGQFTESLVTEPSGKFEFDVTARPGDNVYRLLAGSTSFLGVPAQFSEPKTLRFVLADPVVGWDAIATRAVANQQLAAPEAARDLATLHVAQYDAIASIRSPKAALRNTVDAPRGSSEAAAATAAAYKVLSALFPVQSSLFDKSLEAAKAGLPDTKATRDGFAVGEQVAAATLAWRAKDELAPFSINSASRVLPPPPPAIGSAAFDAALVEVRSLGGVVSNARTDRQTLTAKFWDDGVGTSTNPGMWNQAAQRLASKQKTSLWKNARTFAMLDMAMADAGIVSEVAKATYGTPRPETVIRQSDPAFASLLPTPTEPSYNSDQAAYASVASAILGSAFGQKELVTISSVPLNSSRNYANVSLAASDAANSGIYGGVQYSFDVSAGTKLGEQVAKSVVSDFPAG
ncbi:vanadium-dependent haloperoxidase [Tundrisphaera sp. TA3]|uniref:vanadium-dependent haloperoxidase n=1 Tax=Tundrisphaera sp. TA3 TaxID=3435775 RepID=UPI003EBDC99D